MKKDILLIILILITMEGVSQETFQSLCDLGEKEVDNGNYKQAITYYDKALNMGSDDSAAVIWTASLASVCANQIGDDKLAMKYNNIAINNGTTELFIIDQQLDLAKKYEDLETIEQVLIKAKNIEGQFEKYAVKLLYFYYNNNRSEEADKTADEILSVNPANINSMYLKGMIFIKSGQENEGLKLFNDILSFDPDNDKANMQIGFIYYNRAQAIYNSVNEDYSNIKKPTNRDYDKYKKGVNEYLEEYKTCIQYLKKYREDRFHQNVQEAINTAQSRIDYWK